MRRTWQFSSLLLFPIVLLAAILLSAGVSAPAFAQTGGTATPTPTDPSWRAFSAARDAIEEDQSVDLSIINNYDFEFLAWNDGIEAGCVTPEEGASQIQIFTGWNISITSLRNVVYYARVSYNLQTVIVCDQVLAAATPTPAPGATPGAGLPTPVPGSAASGAFVLGGHVQNMSASTFTLMRSAGMSWVKVQVRYRLGDVAASSAAAGYITTARANGFNLLLGIVGYTSEMGNYDSYIASYSQYVADVARLGANAIEVWNEPNIDREWPAASINGATYTRLLASAYNAIRAANPSTLVISGAPAPTGYFGSAGCGAGGCNDDVFMQQMAAAGAASYMDCVGLHYNEGIVAPSVTSGDPRGEYPTYYFGSMLARGYNPFGGKQVCFTELGYLTPEGYGPLPSSFGWAANTSIAEHATWLADAASRAAQSGRVRLMIIWNVDFNGYTGSDPMAGYAILRADGSCPACTTLGSVMRR
ncbi:MAG: hypothetical protein U0694_28670 [Anaerolineae bacterium]